MASTVKKQSVSGSVLLPQVLLRQSLDEASLTFQEIQSHCKLSGPHLLQCLVSLSPFPLLS